MLSSESLGTDLFDCEVRGVPTIQVSVEVVNERNLFMSKRIDLKIDLKLVGHGFSLFSQITLCFLFFITNHGKR